MKTVIRQLALAGLFALAAGSAVAGVTVTYTEPDKFSDLPFTSWDREQVLKDLSGHFVKLGKALPVGQDLKVEVLDIDLAGREYPGARARDIRILKGGADWPHMHIRYRLEANGQIIDSGEAQLSDMMYMNRLQHYTDSDSLRYEKRMIDEWFEKTILKKKAG